MIPTTSLKNNKAVSQSLTSFILDLMKTKKNPYLRYLKIFFRNDFVRKGILTVIGLLCHLLHYLY